MSTKTEATIEDLYDVPENGKAELVNGEIIQMPPTGGLSGRAGGKIYRSLDDYEQNTKSGYAFPDNVGFTVNLPDSKHFMSDPKKISEGEFLAIVNAALRNPPTMLKDPNMSPQDRRDAAMRDLVLHLRQWFGLSPHIFVQSAFPIAALNYRFTIQ